MLKIVLARTIGVIESLQEKRASLARCVANSQ